VPGWQEPERLDLTGQVVLLGSTNKVALGMTLPGGFLQATNVEFDDAWVVFFSPCCTSFINVPCMCTSG
jgi:hypothetical protein